jgi:hypothetical protein
MLLVHRVYPSWLDDTDRPEMTLDVGCRRGGGKALVIDQERIRLKRCIGETSMGRDKVFRDPKGGERCQMR